LFILLLLSIFVPSSSAATTVASSAAVAPSSSPLSFTSSLIQRKRRLRRSDFKRRDLEYHSSFLTSMPRGGGDGDGNANSSAGTVANSSSANNANSSGRNGNITSSSSSEITNKVERSHSGEHLVFSQRASMLREAVFPIYASEEISKFLALGAIKFCIVFVLTLTRDTKDTLIVTQCGAEAIAFLKVYAVLPLTALYIAYYSKLSAAITNKRLLFYITAIPFFVFYVVFAMFIFPNSNVLHMSFEKAVTLLGTTSSGDSNGARYVLAKILSNWTSALFYAVSEIYSSVSINILFWQFANEVVPIHQASRFYPLFGQMSSLAPIFAGQFTVRYASKAATMQGSLNRMTAIITLCGFAIIYFYDVSCRIIEKSSVKSAAAAAALASKRSSTSSSPVSPPVVSSFPSKKKKEKVKMSLFESISVLSSSPYLRNLSVLVLGYGLSINFTEILWKSLVKRKYSNLLDYQSFMGQFSSAVGATTFFVIFIGGNVIKHLGWKAGAMATPVLMSALAAPFFISVIMLKYKEGGGGGDDINFEHLLAMAVAVGTAQSLLSKATKYALFDPTTQMAYIPLDEESKTKGKAAIDVLGSRLGKSGGSLIQQFLVVCFGDIVKASPALMGVFYIVQGYWIYSVRKLSVLFEEKKKNMGRGNDLRRMNVGVADAAVGKVSSKKNV
jgi:AAA family ATP:ADP antiporter